MNKRPGHVHVSTEVAFCPFCNRSRTLRREEHQLGNLVRTIVTCETCHRTLSSTIGVATPPAEPAAEPVAEEVPAKQEPVHAPAAPKRATAKRATAPKKAAPAKPKSMAKTTRKK